MPSIADSTSLGAGFAAGLYAGIWKDIKEIEGLVKLKGKVDPDLKRKETFDAKYKKWVSTIDVLLKM